MNVSFLNQRLVLRFLSGQLISLQEPVLLGHVKEFQGDFQGLFSCADQTQRKKKIGYDSVLWLHQAHPLAELDFQRLGQLLRVVGLSFKRERGRGPCDWNDSLIPQMIRLSFQGHPGLQNRQVQPFGALVALWVELHGAGYPGVRQGEFSLQFVGCPEIGCEAVGVGLGLGQGLELLYGLIDPAFEEVTYRLSFRAVARVFQARGGCQTGSKSLGHRDTADAPFGTLQRGAIDPQAGPHRLPDQEPQTEDPWPGNPGFCGPVHALIVRAWSAANKAHLRPQKV